MKRQFLFIILFAVIHFHVIAQNSVPYVIAAPKDFPSDVLADGAQLLSKATGRQWQTAAETQDVTKGIVLKISLSPSFTTKESFRFQSDGSNLITISSSSTEGLVFGLYRHLRSLGFKFYLPDELYTIIPSISNPFGLKKDIVDKPFLQIRDFFGTGGYGSHIPDEDISVANDWRLWKARNGFGAAYYLGGHTGEGFILENRKTLLDHPQWLVSPLTANANADQQIKLNYLNKEAVNYYADWALNRFKKPDYKLPPPGHTDLVSVEPADGGGFLNDLPQNEGKKLPSVSDQVYGLANLAAQKLDKLFPNNPNIGVNLYAYNSHAEPPTFALHPRVFVQLIPYQFQNFAFGPSFIKLWASKVKHFAIYDYFNYTDAQMNVPGGTTLEEVMRRLVHSVKSGSEGTTFETSFSKFSTGVPLWVIGRYMADGDADWQKNLSAVSTDLYKTAKQPTGELFHLLYNEAAFNVNHLGNAVALVDQADHLSKDEQVQKRISELKEYLYFTHLVYQSRDLSKGSLKTRTVPVAEYAWKLYESKIVHSYRIMQIVSYGFLSIDRSDKDYATYQQLHTDWFPETPRSKAVWASVSQNVPQRQIEKDFETLKKTYSRAAATESYTIADVTREIASKYKPKKTMVIGGDYSARGYFGIYADKPVEVKIKYSLTNASGNPKVNISSIDKGFSNAGAFVLDQAKGELKFSVPKGETTVFMNASTNTSYRMEIHIDDGILFFDGAPRGTLAFYKNFSDPFNAYTYDPSFYPSYIFFPKNLKAIDYKVQLDALAITSPSGKKSNSRLIQKGDGGHEIRQLDVNVNESGKIWKTVIGGNYGYNFINIPDRYYLLEEK